MAENKKSIIVYIEWINIFEELSDEEAGKLIKHLFRYVNDKNPEAPDRLTKLLFEPIKQTLKRDLVKYENKREKNRNNARKRWDKKNAIASDGIKTDANHAVNDNDSVNDNVNVNVNVIKEKPSDKPIDFIDQIVNTFVEEHGSYEIITPGIERKMAGVLLKKYKEKYPNSTSEETINGLRTYFKMCINIDEGWLRDNMSLSTIVNKFNVINKILNNGKSKKTKGATLNEIAELLINKYGTDE